METVVVSQKVALQPQTTTINLQGETTVFWRTRVQLFDPYQSLGDLSRWPLVVTLVWTALVQTKQWHWRGALEEHKYKAANLHCKSLALKPEAAAWENKVTQTP